MRKLSLYVFACSISIMVWGQGLNEKVEESFSTASSILSFEMKSTQLTGSSQLRISDYLTRFEAKEFTMDQIQTIRTAQPSQLSIALNFEGLDIELKLIANELYGEEQNFNYTPPPGAAYSIFARNDQRLHYNGVIEDQPGSICSFSLLSDHISIMFALPDLGNFEVSRVPGTSDQYVVYRVADLAQSSTFKCNSTDLESTIESQIETQLSLENQRGNGCVLVHIFCDQTMYQDFGEDPVALEDYVTGFFNQVSTIYDNESLDVRLGPVLTYYTEPDGFSSLSSQTALTQFFSAVNYNFIGHLAHLISTDDFNLGGLAYLDELCDLKPFAYSNIDEIYNDFPTYSFTVAVVAHEIGHNLGSKHTHWCGWPGGAIDNCAPVEEGPCDSDGIPSNGGTIMSYCHLQSVGVNFSLGFGTLPGDLIRQKVADASCINGCNLSPLADLEAYNPSTATYQVDQETLVNVSFEVRNIGAAPSAATQASIFLSIDDNIGVGDPRINAGDVEIPALSVNGSQTINAQAYILNTGDGGIHHLIFHADAGANNLEDDEENNQTAIAIYINAPAPDLVINNAEIPDTINIGDQVAISCNAENIGQASSEFFWINYFLSNDTIADDDDWLNPFNNIVLVLDPGMSRPESTTLQLPAETATGYYYLLICADEDQRIAEENEVNNCTWQQVFVDEPGVDLLIDNVELGRQTVNIGMTVQFELDLVNQGFLQSSSSNTAVYLSSDAILDESDTLLASIPSNSVPAGESQSTIGAMVIPMSLPLGEYFIIFCADNDEDVVEFNESNNCSVMPVTVVDEPSDLIIVDMTVLPNVLMIDDPFTIRGKVVNAGLSPTPGLSRLEYHLVTEPGVDSVLIGFNTIPADLLPDDTIEYEHNYLFNHAYEHLWSGDYSLSMCADVNNAFDEINESNNCASVGFTMVNPTPDLIVTNVVPESDPFVAGGYLLTNYTVKYIGDGYSPSPETTAGGYYTAISDTHNITSDIFYKIVPELYPGDSFSFNWNELFGVTYPDSEVELYLCADIENELPEIDEINNCNSTVVQIEARFIDIETYALSVQDADHPGAYITINYFVQNNGNHDVSGQTVDVSFYLSEDQQVDAGDLLLGNGIAWIPDGGDFTTSDWEGYLPTNIFPGTYYLIAHADSDNEVNEPLEVNNYAVETLILDQAEYDLEAKNQTAYIAAFASGQLSLEVDVYNNGFDDVPYSDLWIGFSEDSVKSDDDIEYYFEELGIIEANEHKFRRVTDLYLPNYITAGSYNFLYCVDTGNVVFETNEMNNCKVRTITVQDPRLDLTIEIDSIYGDLYQGGSITSIITVRNIGLFNSPPSMAEYLLSTDTIPDNDDILLGVFDVEGVHNLQPITIEHINAVDDLISIGDYFLIVKIDTEDFVAEEDETNNIAFHPVTITEFNRDLTCLNATVDGQYVENGFIDMTVEIHNIGTTHTPPSNVAFYLSLDNIPSLDDRFIYQNNFPRIDPGQFITRSSSYSLQDVDDGLHHIIFCADYENELTESNEGNNCTSVPIEFFSGYPDLEVREFYPRDDIYPHSEEIEIYYGVKNNGDIDASNSEVALYMSEDSSFDAGDELIITDPMGQVGSLSYSLHTVDIVAPDGIQVDDEFHFILCADASNVVDEWDEENNCKVSERIVVSQSGFDVDILSLSITGQFWNGGDVEMEAIFKNVGFWTLEENVRTGFYLSIDQVLDDEDHRLTSRLVQNNVNPGQTRTVTVTDNLPDFNGEHFKYLLGFVDDDEVYVESNEGNNLEWLPVNINYFPPSSSGIFQLGGQASATLFPNPNSGLCQLMLNGLVNMSVKINIHSLLGETIQSYQENVTLEDFELEIDMSSYPNGTYILDVLDEKNQRLGSTKFQKLN